MIVLSAPTGQKSQYGEVDIVLPPSTIDKSIF